MAQLSNQAQDFIHGKVWAHIATLMKDGSPQVTPVWVETDGSNVVINTAEGRVKTRNLHRDGRVAMSIMGMESPYKCLWVRGRVKEITTRGAEEHINELSRKYTGKDYNYRAGEVRVKLVIEPTHVTERGLA
ncbi:MAG: PPOX class F420-dependent oxidoreductase [SAR202 cluster bacterium]|nr:PPOX class F420-dependent oxidoreductase [SAR202 cluster bacterium]